MDRAELIASIRRVLQHFRTSRAALLTAAVAAATIIVLIATLIVTGDDAEQASPLTSGQPADLREGPETTATGEPSPTSSRDGEAGVDASASPVPGSEGAISPSEDDPGPTTSSDDDAPGPAAFTYSTRIDPVRPWSGGKATQYAACVEGNAVGGGFQTRRDIVQAYLLGSQPFHEVPGEGDVKMGARPDGAYGAPRGWVVDAQQQAPPTTDSNWNRLRAAVVCSNVTDLMTVVASKDLPDGPTTVALNVECPDGYSALSGGVGGEWTQSVTTSAPLFAGDVQTAAMNDGTRAAAVGWRGEARFGDLTGHERKLVVGVVCSRRVGTVTAVDSFELGADGAYRSQVVNCPTGSVAVHAGMQVASGSEAPYTMGSSPVFGGGKRVVEMELGQVHGPPVGWYFEAESRPDSDAVTMKTAVVCALN